MNELNKALDDLDGLHETFRALSDTGRASPLVRNAKRSKSLRQELSAGAEVYVSTLMASSRGELDAKRLNRCRRAALERMPAALVDQKRLAALVEERREADPAARQDVQTLLTLSLHCRAALAAMAPAVDRRAAEALGNKVLIELRAATLLYLSTARHGDGSAEAARAAVIDQLKKTEGHAEEFVALAPSRDDASLGATLSHDVVAMLHKTLVDWESASTAAPAAAVG